MPRALLFIAAMIVTTLAFLAPAQAAVCTIANSELVFEAVETLSTVPTEASTEIGVECLLDEDETQVTMCLHIGLGSGGSGNRLLPANSAASALAYQLFDGANAWLDQPKRIVLSGSAGGDIDDEVAVTGVIITPQTNAAVDTYAETLPINAEYVAGVVEECGDLSGAPLTAELQVSAAVDANCAVTAEDIDFGTVGSVENGVEPAEGGLLITCTPGIDYTITLGTGLHWNGSTRRMSGPFGGMVGYELWTDDYEWGTDPGALRPGDGAEDLYPITGVVPPQAAQPAGSYSDTVVVTIAY